MEKLQIFMGSYTLLKHIIPENRVPDGRNFNAGSADRILYTYHEGGFLILPVHWILVSLYRLWIFAKYAVMADINLWPRLHQLGVSVVASGRMAWSASVFQEYIPDVKHDLPILRFLFIVITLLQLL